MISELASKVFATRDFIHQKHWATTSYAEHMALGAFYDALIEQIDGIVENYQGLFGRIEKFTPEPVQADDVITHLQDEADWIESVRADIAQGSPALENLIDGLTSTYLKTIYLLSLK